VNSPRCRNKRLYLSGAIEGLMQQRYDTSITMPRFSGNDTTLRWFLILLASLAVLSRHTPAWAAALETVEIASKSGTHRFSVEIARTEKEQQRGLMFRKKLPEGAGMLFEFRKERPISFWMKNTYVPLDIIFIRNNGRILSIAENTVPMSDRLIPSRGPVRGVLEVIAGTANKFGIAPGDQVTHRIFQGK